MKYVMDKDEVIYQLKQEGITALESMDEARVHEVMTGHSTEESRVTPGVYKSYIPINVSKSFSKLKQTSTSCG